MHKIATPLFCVMVVASMWPASVFALEYRGTVKGTAVEPGYLEYRILPGADSVTALEFSDARGAGVRKIEDVPIVFDNAGRPVAGVGQDTKLSLLQNVPLASPVSPPTGNGRHEEQWVRIADNRMPEPGSWAVLIAGILGICAVARPRIFSS